jgi:hypothetical protein
VLPRAPVQGQAAAPLVAAQHNCCCCCCCVPKLQGACQVQQWPCCGELPQTCKATWRGGRVLYVNAIALTTSGIAYHGKRAIVPLWQGRGMPLWRPSPRLDWTNPMSGVTEFVYIEKLFYNKLHPTSCPCALFADNLLTLPQPQQLMLLVCQGQAARKLSPLPHPLPVWCIPAAACSTVLYVIP